MFGISAFAAGPFSSEATSTFNAIVSEASNVSASFIGANNIDVSVAEAVSGAMYTVGVVPIETAVTEGTAIVGATGATLFIGGVVSEGSVILALPTGANNLSVSFADASNTTDSMSARLTKPTTVTEGVNATVDAIYATFNPRGVISERAGIVINIYTITEVNSIITEASTAAENVLVSQTYYRNISEAAAISSADSGDLLWELINTYEPADWVNVKTLN